MININTAKTPWGLLYFSALSFFSSLLKEGGRVHFHWNFPTGIVKLFHFQWNNSISTKVKKEERKIIRELYINSLVVIL